MSMVYCLIAYYFCKAEIDKYFCNSQFLEVVT